MILMMNQNYDVILILIVFLNIMDDSYMLQDVNLLKIVFELYILYTINSISKMTILITISFYAFVNNNTVLIFILMMLMLY
jgi:hypothetical protein